MDLGVFPLERGLEETSFLPCSLPKSSFYVLLKSHPVMAPWIFAHGSGRGIGSAGVAAPRAKTPLARTMRSEPTER